MTTTTLPTDIKKIERPEWTHDKPADLNTTTQRYGTGRHDGIPISVFEYPDGRIVEANMQAPHCPKYRVFSSWEAFHIEAGSYAVPDVEGPRRFFPSDYKRLKIDRVTVPSDVSVTGHQHCPGCTCHGCGTMTDYYKVIFAHSATSGYIPLCKSCHTEQF